MTVKELKAALEEMKLQAKGGKAALVARLQEAQAAATGVPLHCDSTFYMPNLSMRKVGCGPTIMTHVLCITCSQLSTR